MRRAGGGCETGCWAAVMQGARAKCCASCKQPMKPGCGCALMSDADQSRAAGAKRKAGAARMRTFPLSFREPIQGPKNASIARFDGLGCYRSGSEKRWLAAGGRRLRNGLLGCRDARLAGRNAAALQAAREIGLRTALMPDAAQSWAADAKRKPGAIQARFGEFCWIRLGLMGPGWSAQSSRARPGSSRQGWPSRLFALESGANSRPKKCPHRTV